LFACLFVMNVSWSKGYFEHTKKMYF